MQISYETFAMVLAGLWGACVGSFLNVVIYRLPEGMSIVLPPSHCPKCGHRLAFFENVPILGWLVLRGRCRKCRSPISVQYPLVELFTAGLSLAIVAALYRTHCRESFASWGVAETWPALLCVLVMCWAMIAATVIDARYYIIPLGITWTIALAALIVLPGATAIGLIPPGAWDVGLRWETLSAVLFTIELPGPGVTWTVAQQLGLALGGMLGLVIANGLLMLRILPRSFDEEPTPEADSSELPDTRHDTGDASPQVLANDTADPNDPQQFLAHPHPRKEIAKECLFLLPVVVGMIVGARLGGSYWQGVALPMWSQVLGGVLLGYLVGGGVVWGIRLFGTFMFGKEAMGLGDVHLMAAVGCVIGATDVTVAFFVAPFIGLSATAVLALVGTIKDGRVRVIPYGPYLCAAVIVVLLWRQPLLSWIV
jgi:leader peptidase (prepilin peptidase)/N-methyltransferase